MGIGNLATNTGVRLDLGVGNVATNTGVGIDRGCW